MSEPLKVGDRVVYWYDVTEGLLDDHWIGEIVGVSKTSASQWEVAWPNGGCWIVGQDLLVRWTPELAQTGAGIILAR